MTAIYDPFVRGRYPVGVRTIEARDPARSRRFPCEVVMIPLAGLSEVFDRTPATRRMAVLRRADHAHFLHHVEEEHEAVRATPFTGELAWIPKEMRPASELCPGEQAHLFVRGLTLCHMDAALRGQEDARRRLLGDVASELASRGVDAFLHGSPR